MNRRVTTVCPGLFPRRGRSITARVQRGCAMIRFFSLCVRSSLCSVFLFGCGQNPPPTVPSTASAVTASPLPAPAVASIGNQQAIAAEPPSCVPSRDQPETVALHQSVSESIEWKSPGAIQGKPQTIKVLGFNDFHGQLSSPPAVDGRALGGAALLASYFRAAASGHEGSTLVVHAGDLIGASPPASALHQDEPTVEFLGAILGPGCSRRDRRSDLCPVVASLGNHEFDEGVIELRRIVSGGNHARGPFLGHDYAGAPFEYIGANVRDKKTGEPVVSPSIVKTLAGVRVGLVGAVLHDAPVFLMPSGIKTLSFDDEVSAINTEVESLSKLGVHAIIVVLHQGGYQCFAPGVPHDERSVTGPIVDIVKHLHPEVDLVVSGHTHSVLNALLPNSAGKPTLVTQAFHAGTGFADIDLTIDTATDDVVAKRARVVTPWAEGAPGIGPDPQVAAKVKVAEDAVRTRTSHIVGSATGTFHAAPDAAGNSELGNLIVAAQREMAGVDLAFTTPSWVRGDLAAGDITWGNLFRVQPFGNRLVKMQLTGQQVFDLLNQQWAIEDHPRILHAAGLAYRWDATRPAGDRVVDVQRSGKSLDRKQRFTIVVNEYLAEGGDGFSVLAALPRQTTPLQDIDALERYVKKHSPITVDPAQHIQRLP